MTRKEKIDWLNRLRSEIAMYIPKRWLIPMYTALDTAIDELQRETVSREAYEHEYFLRKELELKVTKLEEQIAKQKSEIERQLFNKFFFKFFIANFYFHSSITFLILLSIG